MLIYNKKTLIRWKVYVDRSKMYVGYIQFSLIIFVFLKSLENPVLTEFIFEHPSISFPIVLLTFLFFSLFIGYLDSKLGLREEEIRNYSVSNPILMEMKQTLQVLNQMILTDKALLEEAISELRAPLKSPSISARVLAVYKTRRTLKGMTSPFRSV